LKSFEETETHKFFKVKKEVENIKNYYINGCTDRRITSAKLVRALTVKQVRDFAKELIDKGKRHELILEGK